jgi:hypothetical protein
MASGTERAFDDAFALGRQNQVTVELARRHCLNMEFPEFGGRGMAEEGQWAADQHAPSPLSIWASVRQRIDEPAGARHRVL